MKEKHFGWQQKISKLQNKTIKAIYVFQIENGQPNKWKNKLAEISVKVCDRIVRNRIKWG